MEKEPLKYDSADIPNFYPEQNMEPLQFLHARCEPCFNDFHFKSFSVLKLTQRGLLGEYF